jgi:hypothetical protein
MNNFELFTMMFFTLDLQFKNNKSDENLANYLSSLNPFLWEECTSADPAYYTEFQEFMSDKKIGDDYGYSLVLSFLHSNKYSKGMEKYFLMTPKEKYIEGTIRYLSQPHKGET